MRRVVNSPSSASAALCEASISTLTSSRVRPANPGVEKIAGFDQGRLRQPSRNMKNAVFDRSVLGHKHGERAFRLDSDEFDVFQPRVFLGRHDNAGPARKTR